jgi:hypothetical protein
LEATINVPLDPATVPGLPESSLRAEHLTVLPSSSPPPPWNCRVEAVLWTQRATRPPSEGLAFDWLGQSTGLTVAGFIRYLESPVGPYHEVLAGSMVRTGFRPALQVPFIAVDSLASVAGGRINWALPKTVADFEVDLAGASARAEGADWSLAVQPAGERPSARRPVPLRAVLPAIGPLGTYRTSLRGRARLVRVRTQADGETLSGWLGSGTHVAVVLTGTARVNAPR